MAKNNDTELWETCEMVLDAFPEPILLIQKDLQIRFANRTARKFFRIENFTSISFVDLITEKTEKVESWLKHALRSSIMIPGKFNLVNEGTLFFESKVISFLDTVYIMLRVRRKTLRAKMIDLTIQMQEKNKEIAHHLCVEEKLLKTQKKLTEMVRIDFLTKVSNRHNFNLEIEKMWSIYRRQQVPLTLIMIDIDYFKLFNDTYGHVQGDKCLQKVASALSSCVRRASDVVARYGGEEFSILLNNYNFSQIECLIDKIFMAIRDLNIPHKASPKNKFVTISAGIASTINLCIQNVQQIIENADSALYMAKNRGRNNYVIYGKE